MKFLKLPFSIGPKRFNPIDMIFPFDKFIVSMFDIEMLFIAHIYKTQKLYQPEMTAITRLLIRKLLDVPL